MGCQIAGTRSITARFDQAQAAADIASVIQV
jgi:hypothetical protein